MGNYLSNIAERSLGNTTLSLAPSQPLAGTPTEVQQDFVEENITPDSPPQNQTVQETILPIQPIQLSRIQQDINTVKTETFVQEKNTELNYFSKHVERVQVYEEQRQTENKADAPQNTLENIRVEKSPQKNIEEKIQEKPEENELPIIVKSVSKIIPQKMEEEKESIDKPSIKPQVTDSSLETAVFKNQNTNAPINNEDRVNNKLQPVNSFIEHIRPNKPDPGKNEPVQNKVNQAANKLVIGKITVEILPPANPSHTKIINRVIQRPAATGQSKVNKLSFGLGQL